MGHLLDGFQRRSDGGISIRTFDSDQMPEGWFDAPDKVPPLIRGGKVVPDPARPKVVASQSEATISANLGTHEARPYGSAARSHSEVARVQPRENGRFVKAAR